MRTGQETNISLATGRAQVSKSLFLPNWSWTHKVSLGQRSPRTSPGFAPISGRTLPNASSSPPLSQSGFLVLPRLSCATNSKATKMGETVQISCSTYTNSWDVQETLFLAQMIPKCAGLWLSSHPELLFVGKKWAIAQKHGNTRKPNLQANIIANGTIMPKSRTLI